MKEQRKIVPPVYMLVALLAMVGLHYAMPLALIVAPPVSGLEVWLLLGTLSAALPIAIWTKAACGDGSEQK